MRHYGQSANYLVKATNGKILMHKALTMTGRILKLESENEQLKEWREGHLSSAKV